MDNIEHCLLLCIVELFNSHRDAIADFTGSLVSDWTMALNTCNTSRELEGAGRM